MFKIFVVSLISYSYLFAVVQTGIYTSYTIGDDGYYSSGKTRDFTREGYIVYDNVTNLMWQDTMSYVFVDYEGAVRGCENLTLDGYDDWRLPNIYELSTLIDYSQNPAFDPVFENKDLRYLWASDFDKNDPSRAWIQIFHNLKEGRWIDKTSKTSDWSGYYNTYRCVRGVMTPIEYQNEGGVVYDITNGLVWQDEQLQTTLATMDGVTQEYIDAQMYMLWGEARDYCESLDYADRNDWRLPTINELMATLNPTTLQTDSAFEFVYDSAYWSSTFYPEAYGGSSDLAAYALDVETATTNQVLTASEGDSQKHYGGGKRIVRCVASIIDDSHYAHLTDGWHLLGALEEIKNMNYFRGAKILWIYEGGDWTSYKQTQQLQELNITQGQGFWIYK